LARNNKYAQNSIRKQVHDEQLIFGQHTLMEDADAMHQPVHQGTVADWEKATLHILCGDAICQEALCVHLYGALRNKVAADRRALAARGNENYASFRDRKRAEHCISWLGHRFEQGG